MTLNHCIDSKIGLSLGCKNENMAATSLQYQSKQSVLLNGKYTVAEYLEIEARTGERHEFYNGEVIHMSGGSINHNRISKNILQYLGNELDKKTGLELFGSDQKIFLPKLNFYLYPDAIVVAKTPIMAETDAQAIVNPILIVEVLSPTTEDYDRKDKFLRYRSLESFQEYVLIQQDHSEILTLFRSTPHTWEEEEFVGIETTIHFKSIDVHLPLSLIYRNVTFGA